MVPSSRNSVIVQKKNKEQMRQDGILCIWGNKGGYHKRSVEYYHNVGRLSRVALLLEVSKLLILETISEARYIFSF